MNQAGGEVTARRGSTAFVAALIGGVIGSLLTAALLWFAAPQLLSTKIVRQGMLADPQILAAGEPEIRPEHIVFDRTVRLVEAAPPHDETEAGAGEKLSKIVQISEARAIMETLDACGGRRAQAARQLGISERTLRYRLASFREAGLAIGSGR